MVIYNFGWCPMDIGIVDILKILKDKNVPLEKAYITLNYNGDYDENPELVLCTSLTEDDGIEKFISFE